MEFIPRRLKGVLEIRLDPRYDNRGFFMRTYDIKDFEKSGIDIRWAQENHSRSESRGIIRGLHFQFPPFAETKLVRCIRGAVFDVFVDLRKNSATFGQWDSIELTEENKVSVIIPRGFAHGFCTMSETSEVIYKVDNFYSPKHEGGILWNDPDLNIDWPVEGEPVLSEKDRGNMRFREFVDKYKGIDV